MADYIYLLENRLSISQQRALGTIRSVARSHEFTVFLTGGAVRDLSGGGSVRDLDVTVQGDPAKLRTDLEAAGAVFTGEHAEAQVHYFSFPGGVRAEVAAAMSVTYPKPGQPKFEAANISDDLRRRDFTANAMAISLNEGSYGLLMDPLNGTADIENRELRLVSNYGFIEDPSRLMRAVRLMSRLSWQMEERTRARYETAKEEGYVSALSAWSRGYETEEIFLEEDPLRAMRALAAEGWLGVLSPVLDPAKVNTTALEDLRDRQGQLQTQGIVAPVAAIAFPLLTAKLPASEVEALKATFARPGFVREIDSVEAETRQMQTRFVSKEMAAPSQVWKMLHQAEPAAVLSLLFSGKSAAVQGKFKTFLSESPTARQRIPYALMQEMRITPEVDGYAELLDTLFYELMDNRLQTAEEMKAYLAPYSPPAPLPPVSLRRAKAKKEPRPSRAKSKKAAAEKEASTTVAAQEETVAVEHGLLQPGELSRTEQGTEPAAPEMLAGKVAPLGKGEKKGKSGKAATADVPQNIEAAGLPGAAKPGKPAGTTAEIGLVQAVAAAPKKNAVRTAAHPAAAGHAAAKGKPAPLKGDPQEARSGRRTEAAAPKGAGSAQKSGATRGSANAAARVEKRTPERRATAAGKGASAKSGATRDRGGAAAKRITPAKSTGTAKTAGTTKLPGEAKRNQPGSRKGGGKAAKATRPAKGAKPAGDRRSVAAKPKPAKTPPARRAVGKRATAAAQPVKGKGVPARGVAGKGKAASKTSRVVPAKRGAVPSRNSATAAKKAAVAKGKRRR